MTEFATEVYVKEVNNTKLNVFIDNQSFNMNSCIFMKVGSHGEENFQQIIRRKLKEQDKTNFMLWGYSGNLLDALKIREYLKERENADDKFLVFMIETKSPFRSKAIKSKFFSLDRLVWHKLPKQLFTTGCDKAIVCKNLKSVSLQLNLSNFRVSFGPKKGKLLNDYFKNRTDKACADFFISKTEPKIITVKWIAEVVSPYAIYLKHILPVKTALLDGISFDEDLGVFSHYLP